jgi:hypothetical protein
MTSIEMLKAKAKEMMTTEHEFIDSIKIELTSDPKYGWGKDQQLGKYHPLSKKIILFDEFKKFPAHPELALDNIFPTYMHELIHGLQHKNMGTLVYLLCLIFCRPLYEQGARETEDSFYKTK